MKRVLVVLADYTFGLTQPLPTHEAPDRQMWEAALKDTIALCQDLDPGPGAPVPDLVLAYTGDRSWHSQIAPNYWLLVPQMGATLTQVLDNLLIFLSPQPDDEVLILGPRTPHLNPRALAQAYIALGQRGACLGATPAGGVYALGIRGRWPSGVMADVRWTEGSAAAEVTRVFRRLKLGLALLEELEPGAELRQILTLADEPPIVDRRPIPFLRQLGRKLNESG
jgi:hypothetical protein